MPENSDAQPVSQSLKHQFEELQERASKDALSGLLNRVTTEMYINQRLENMAPDETCALFIIDMDNFKQVNDTLGHQAGDQAIQQSARILSRLFRATDIVGRLGGDEFIVFLSGQISEKLIRKKGKEICERLQIVLGSDPSVSVTASVGIHISYGHGMNFDELYQSADLALYKAKKNGRHGFFVKHSSHLTFESQSDDFLPVNTIPLSGLLEHMDSGVSLLEMGEQIRVIYVSPSFCRILGVDSKKYVLPKPLSSIVHPDDLAPLSLALRRGLEKNETVDHTARVTPDGNAWFWWHIRASKIDYNNPHPVMLVTTTDISRFKESEQRLQEINERLQSAFEQTTQGMWEVDLASRVITVFGYDGKDGISESMQGEFPDFIIKNGWIHPNSISRFKEFASELLSGKSQGYGNFILQYYDTGCYGWTAMSYRMLYDDAGRAVKAVGIVEKLPQEFAGQDIKSPIKRFLPEALTAYMIVGLQANLTKDNVKEFWTEGRDLTGQVLENTCTKILKDEESKIFRPDIRQSLSKYFDRKSLLELSAQGKRWINLSYRRTEGCGSIRWVNHVINLAKDPLTQDIYLFVYIVQSDIQHKREMELEIDILRDQATGLYDRATFRAMIEFEIGKGGCHECAMAVIQLVGLEKLYADNSSAINRRRYDLAAAMSTALGPSCVIGQYTNSSLLVFFPDVRCHDDIKRQIEDAFSFVRLALADMPALDSLRFVAGVDCVDINNASYISMTENALQLCQLWHNASADTVAFSQENNDWSWNQLQQNIKAEQLTIGSEGVGRPLSEAQKDVVLKCVSSMLASDSLETSINSVLKFMGNYYRADRVYLLSLAENRHVVTMPFEWTSSKKTSIQQAVSGLFVERFPILKRCMDEHLPVFLTRTTPSGQNSQDNSGRWNFMAFPLIENISTLGFLCIENPREHQIDSALPNTLIPYMLGEQKRFHRKIHMSGNSSSLFLSELPNLRSYMNVIYSLNSDVYSCMGAVCLDVPNLSSINSSQGFEYGSRLLWYVSKTLADIFGHSFIFRTWDAEFVVLCPDITRQVFIGKCTRLRSALQRRYPKDVRIGYTWSEGVFSGKTLVSEARSIMRCEHVKTVPHPLKQAASERRQKTSEAVRLGRFTIYLQPKIHMKTGSLLGAEALVRGLDEEGNIILPDRFIKEMEKSGDIRDLDLYVLDHTLAQMDKWREEGLELKPVSVNFSRITLFDPSALASVLAIQSRYPLLDPSLLALEITEHGINVESSSLSNVMDKFREFGIKFSLDDFGSAYSNLSIFTNVNFDCVKLDRSLISGIVDNPRGKMLVRDIIDICNSSDMLCVAEGVENKAQIDVLIDAGCICAQGFYYDRPMPADRFKEKYLRPVQEDSGK